MKRIILNKLLLWLFTGLIAAVILLPVYWMFLSSITPANKLFTFPINYFPGSATLDNFRQLFKVVDIPRLAFNTLIVSFFSILGSIIFSLLAGYGFTRISHKSLNVALAFIFLTTILPPIAVIIPVFQIFRALHLYDTHLGLIIIYISNLLPFTTFAFVSFYRQIPFTLEEAASVDGAGILRIIFQIIMPIMKPAIATMAIINFILAMNEFITPLILTMENAKMLIVGITEIQRQNEYQIPWDKISAYGTLMLLPIVVFVMSFEKKIMDGILAGSIKG